ncbi:hypothetical protein [Geobacter benzoatilyticus]|uniref:Uncharacterized protein n=1 Tax=Geobacter benzoatilyticus TaxID=2815309 RepID=A0ABX7Q1B4_9BACT|nr:hypothetical protein [Geobacter benzoatilyticus]QSV44731.1 hypothetical protein JZM60_11205 [Geobacter benzoatilyticus]
MYVARDKDSQLYLFKDVPLRGKECWWAEAGVDGTYLRLDKALFPEVTWESEPLPVSLVTVTEGTA